MLLIKEIESKKDGSGYKRKNCINIIPIYKKYCSQDCYWVDKKGNPLGIKIKLMEFMNA